MTENILSAEKPQVTREQVIDTFRKFPEKGITHPDDLSLDDPDVISANGLLHDWANQQEVKARELNTPKANLEYQLNRSTIYVDAGFSDPDYLDEVANDWLAQDLQEAEDVGLTEMVDRIKAKIEEIESKIAK